MDCCSLSLLEASKEGRYEGVAWECLLSFQSSVFREMFGLSLCFFWSSIVFSVVKACKQIKDHTQIQIDANKADWCNCEKRNAKMQSIKTKVKLVILWI